MQVSQIYNLVNEATKAVLGENGLSLSEDLSNLVDVGKAVIRSDNDRDTYYKALVNRIGKQYFVDRPYKGSLPKVFVDSWEFGSIVAKSECDLMEVQENDSWQIIQGTSYDPFVVNLPKVDQRFFNKMRTFELDITWPKQQIEQSFVSADEMNRFLSMVQTAVYNSLEVRIEACVRLTICNFIGATIDDGVGPRYIKLLTEYNGIAPTPLTSANCLLNKDFLTYASRRMNDVKGYLKDLSTIYNEGKKARHTPEDELHVIMLTNFANAIKYSLYGNTYHEEFVKLPNYEEIAFWQGIGTAGTATDRSTIKLDVCKSDGTIASVNQANIVGFFFDKYALGVLQPRKRVTTQYNPKNETYNDFHKWESRYFNDFNENAVVFVLE